ncbi:hypothetical protein JTE90_028389 [Oedothorax gibbosus]|uniref:Selenoprotein P N-terminal domain-containing protein n=1 Tax=Oedothorax gibbosus TaxID=931172 RepID=A0AAV6VC17_9ARAC|nr:hypothetical protein JTE90_028389 [Oedothorax gibbosus]
MGVHRWLLGPVICLIVAQASSLESLRKHFRTYGMTDLRFMIVNSNLQHAQQIVHELQNRVSFDVHQDTKENNVWGLLEGGKDDIYVYDRCGRLAYYIPFPLSIMNHQEGDLVTSAILATYYRSPCGTTCDKNSSTLEDFLNKAAVEESPVDSTTEEAVVTTELSPNPTVDAVSTVESDSSLLEEGVESKANESYVRYDYPTYDETLEDYDDNETDTKHDHAFFNSLYSFFFNSTREVSNTNETLSSNASLTDTNHDQTFHNSLYNRIVKPDTTEKPKVKDEEMNQISAPLNISDQIISESLNNTTPADTESTTIRTLKPKPDRCAEADQSVCRTWSKKRLLRAHDCCSTIEDESSHQMLRYCKNFGKKRCKKIKTILKCCIKTSLFETTTIPIPTDEEDTVATTTVQPVTTSVNEIVCCRDVEEGKLCRVSEEPTCRLGEYLQVDNPEVEEAPREDKVM